MKDGDAMMRDALKVISGCDLDPRTPVKDAVARRASQLIPFIEKKIGGHLYGCNRTRPTNLGWRFLQTTAIKGLDPTAQAIFEGSFDAEIESTYHDAAAAEYYYRFEKDWG